MPPAGAAASGAVAENGADDDGVGAREPNVPGEVRGTLSPNGPGDVPGEVRGTPAPNGPGDVPGEVPGKPAPYGPGEDASDSGPPNDAAVGPPVDDAGVGGSEPDGGAGDAPLPGGDAAGGYVALAGGAEGGSFVGEPSGGGRAKNSVSHLGQRIRAPSSGTDSFLTRYLDAHPGHVTIMPSR
jgi:hypothetical protein